MSRQLSLRGPFHDDVVPGRNERQLVVVMPDELESALKPFYELHERLPTDTESELREIKLDVFVKQLQNLGAALISQPEVLQQERDLLVVTQCTHGTS